MASFIYTVYSWQRLGLFGVIKNSLLWLLFMSLSTIARSNGILFLKIKFFFKYNFKISHMAFLGSRLIDAVIVLQFSSVTQLCPALCDPLDCSTPGFPVHCQLLEPTETHVHWVGDAIQPSHPLSFPSPAFSLSQRQGLFKWVSSLHQVAEVLEFQLQHQSFTSFRTDWFDLLFGYAMRRIQYAISLLWQSKGVSRVFSNTRVPNHQFFGTQLSL